jgi:DNA-binding phage protein
MAKASPHLCTCPACKLHPAGKLARAHRDLNRLLATLDERGRRLVAGFLAREEGTGAIRRLARITGLSRNTIRRGMRDRGRPMLASGAGRIRQVGGGRKLTEKKGAPSLAH